MTEKLKKYFEQDIALAVISGLKKGADCEFSKVTVRPFTAGDEIKYQFEYTVKAQVKSAACSLKYQLSKYGFLFCFFMSSPPFRYLSHFFHRIFVVY